MTSSDAATGADQLGGRRAAESAPPPVYGGSGGVQTSPPQQPVNRPEFAPPRESQSQARPQPQAQAQPQGYALAARQAVAYAPSTPPPAKSAPPAPTSSGGRTRQARLRLARLDPWSVMKVSFVLSVALGVITIVAIAVLWIVLDQMGVFSSVSKAVGDIASSNQSNAFSLQSYLSFGNVLGFSLIIALVDIILVTALSTLGTFLYNLSAGMVGGIEVTLAEDD